MYVYTVLYSILHTRTTHTHLTHCNVIPTTYDHVTTLHYITLHYITQARLRVVGTCVYLQNERAIKYCRYVCVCARERV
jgi:hypothetical protein